MRPQHPLGTGISLDPDSLIVATSHVVAATQQITVGLNERCQFAGRVVVSNGYTGLAVLKIDTASEKPPALNLRETDRLEVGDLLLAIGDPFGVGQTVTSGIVPALARIGIGRKVPSFIQAGSTINPDDSSSGFVDRDGKLAGISMAIFSQPWGWADIGFAAPTALPRTVVRAAITGAPIRRHWRGRPGRRSW